MGFVMLLPHDGRRTGRASNASVRGALDDLRPQDRNPSLLDTSKASKALLSEPGGSCGRVCVCVCVCVCVNRCF